MKVRKDKGQVPPLRALKLLCEKQPEVAEEIVGWAMSGTHTNAEIRAGIEEQWGIRLSTDGKITELLSWWGVRRRFASAESRAEQIMERLREKGAGFGSPEQIAEVAHNLFTLEAVEGADARTYIALEQLALDKRSAKTRAEIERRKLELAERRVSVLEQKMADAAAQLRKLRQPGAAMDDAERQAILDEVDRIMGLKK